jgi:hypothetical protein
MKNKSTKKELSRTTNALDYLTTNEKYQVFPEGIMVCKINLPRNIEYGKREKFLYSIGRQFISMNIGIDESNVFSYLDSVNMIKGVFSIQLTTQSINKIVSMLFKQLEKEGEFPLVPNKLRKIIFNDINYNITKEEKRIIMNKEIGLLKQNKTKDLIYQAIEGWSKPTKITAANIATEIGMSLRTIKTYWPEFKDYVKDINQDIKLCNLNEDKIKIVSEDLEQEIESEIEDNEELEGQETYSIVTFKTFLIKEKHLEVWDLVKDWKGVINQIAKNTNQYGFDYDMDRVYDEHKDKVTN